MAPRQRSLHKKANHRGGAIPKHHRSPEGGKASHHHGNHHHGSHHSESRSQLPSPWIPLGVHTLVFAVAFLCYVNTLGHDLVHDDIFAIENNQDVHGRLPVQNLLWNDFWGKSMADNTSHKSYRPLSVFTFRLNYMLHELHPLGYHLVNILLHASVSVVFAYVCQAVVFTELLPTFVAGLLFATHPIHTEAVAGVVGRADLLACLFFLMSFLAYERSLKSGKSGFAITCKPACLVLSLFLAVCALLSKEHGATILGVLIAYDVMVSSRPGCQRILLTRRFGRGCMPLVKRCAIIVATGLVLLGGRLWMLHGHLPHFSEQDNPASFAPHLSTRFLSYTHLIFFNVWLLLCPTTLSYDWQMNSIPLVESVWDVRNLATLATVAVLVAIAMSTILVTKDKERRVLVLGLLFLVVPFLPASNIFIRVGFVVAERILYIPSVGFCILSAYILNKMKGVSSKHGTAIIAVTVGVIVLLFSWKTLSRNQVWRSRESLFRSGLETLPHNAKMHYNYANLLRDNGKIQEAIQHYQTSLRLWPEHASANNNLGTLLKDDPKQAEQHYRQALLINPNHVRAHYNLASQLSKSGHVDEAESLFRRALHLDPEFADIHTNLASLLESKGLLLEAEQLYLNALTLDPKNGDYCNNYGAFLTNTGRYEDARTQYNECLHLQPNHTVLLGNQARLLRRFGETRQAEELFLRALSLDRRPGLLESLGALYFNTNRPSKAYDVYKEAVALNPTNVETRTHYGQVLASLGQVNQAIAELQVALEMDGNSAEAHRQLASIYIMANKHREGLKHATMALQLDPDSDATRKAGLLFEMGNCLKELKRDQEAVQSYQEAVKLNPHHSSAHLNLGAMLHLQGDFTGASAHYQEALKLDPDNATLKQNIAKLSRAKQKHKYDRSKQDNRNPVKN